MVAQLGKTLSLGLIFLFCTAETHRSTLVQLPNDESFEIDSMAREIRPIPAVPKRKMMASLDRDLTRPARRFGGSAIPTPYQGTSRPASVTNLSEILRLLRPADPGQAVLSTGTLPVGTAKLSAAAPPPTFGSAALGASTLNGGGVGTEAGGNGGSAGGGGSGGGGTGGGVSGGGRIGGAGGPGAAQPKAAQNGNGNGNQNGNQNEEEQTITVTTNLVSLLAADETNAGQVGSCHAGSCAPSVNPVAVPVPTANPLSGQVPPQPAGRFVPLPFGTNYLSSSAPAEDTAILRDISSIRTQQATQAATLLGLTPTNPFMAALLPQGGSLSIAATPREMANALRAMNWTDPNFRQLSFSNHGTPTGELQIGGTLYRPEQLQIVWNQIREGNRRRAELGLPPIDVLLTQCYGGVCGQQVADLTGSPVSGSSSTVSSFQPFPLVGQTGGTIRRYLPQNGKQPEPSPEPEAP